jgi:hypothetical protein
VTYTESDYGATPHKSPLPDDDASSDTTQKPSDVDESTEVSYNYRYTGLSIRGETRYFYPPQKLQNPDLTPQQHFLTRFTQISQTTQTSTTEHEICRSVENLSLPISMAFNIVISVPVLHYIQTVLFIKILTIS